eukprot:Tamp_36127.p3 GENE.Tamp_36127~~Tamp_36127.p3  ORF type:complete len:104 (-),score=8.53 Tamp_36127:131-442(-)
MSGHGRTVRAAALWLAALCMLHSLHEAHAQGARGSGKDGDTYSETETESLWEGLETACTSMPTWHAPTCCRPSFATQSRAPARPLAPTLRAHLPTRPPRALRT